jgi:hypothetical protein
MQRLRAGAVGLGLVLMTTVAASLLADAADRAAPADPRAEPLAILGVAPSQTAADPQAFPPVVRHRTAGTPAPATDQVTI